MDQLQKDELAGNFSFAFAVSFFILVLVIGLWDSYVVWKHGGRYTVSAIITEYSRTFPILPLVAGVVLGHLFWAPRIGPPK